MASQSHLRSTYFSTPSTLAHDAYPFWSGELFNRGRASAAERVEIDVSHNALAGGFSVRTVSGGRLSPLRTP